LLFLIQQGSDFGFSAVESSSDGGYHAAFGTYRTPGNGAIADESLDSAKETQI
jgi:hypothetical protein